LLAGGDATALALAVSQVVDNVALARAMDEAGRRSRALFMGGGVATASRPDQQCRFDARASADPSLKGMHLK
jgi:hypothetical protein